MLLIIAAAQTMACAYIILVSVLALNSMSASTAFPVRMAYMSLGTGSIIIVLSPAAANDVFECIFVLGVALYLKGNRRALEH